MLHRVHLDHAPGEGEGDAGGDARPLDRHPHRGPGRATQRLQRLLGGEAAGGLPVDLHDPVAGHDPDALGRRSGQRADDGDAAVTHVHLDADPRVVPARALVQPAEAPGVEEDGMRIVQLVEHAAHGAPVERGVGQRVHIVAPEVLEHLLEQPSL
jgi:hypothetical protein